MRARAAHDHRLHPRQLRAGGRGAAAPGRARARGGRDGARAAPRWSSAIGSTPGEGVELGADPDGETDLALVLGGDGTILSTLRRYADRDVPVFALNYGAIGFLATVEADDLDAGLAPRAAGRLRGARPAGADRRDRRRRGDGDQRHLLPPPPQRARGRGRLLGRRRDARRGALRRPGRLHAGRLDRLQPRQRRAGAGLGRGGLRRLVHRAAHADRPRAGGRARATCSRSPTSRRSRRST